MAKKSKINITIVNSQFSATTIGECFRTSPFLISDSSVLSVISTPQLLIKWILSDILSDV
jgi:hypothetical protein